MKRELGHRMASVVKYVHQKESGYSFCFTKKRGAESITEVNDVIILQLIYQLCKKTDLNISFLCADRVKV